ncbi:MAG: DUF5596 domain-containing protein [Clostridia bacterium]|nr:DUF5596 domain-containing protein [Clostridia bacterium]
MTAEELYALIELPVPVAERYRQMDSAGETVMDGELRGRLLCRERWGEAVKEMQRRLGDDPDSLLALREELHIALDTWEGYRKAGISLDIFRETMRFATRYLNDQLKAVGRYGFTAPWWFPRQLAMEEFRLGSLEFELATEDEGRFVSVHIPSDASLRPADVDESFARARAFIAAYFPGWTDAVWSCDSWMMAPVLNRLLPGDSNILAFQRRFTLRSLNLATNGAISWVFPGRREPSPDLQEDTSLQRRMKAFVLSGGVVGWGRGEIMNE